MRRHLGANPELNVTVWGVMKLEASTTDTVFPTLDWLWLFLHDMCHRVCSFFNLFVRSID